MKIEMITSAAPIPKVLFGSKPKSGTDAMHETRMATAIARFLRLLSANRITTATSNPPKANMHTTAHVPGQNPCSHPLRITLPQSRWYTARNWMKEAQKTREGGREGGREGEAIRG